MSTGFAEELDMTEIDSPEALDTKETPEEGTYLCCVTSHDPAPRNVENAMRVEFEILSGTVERQSGKSFSELFNAPTAKAKDGGKFYLKRRVKLALATGLVSEADLGKRVAIDWNDIVGRLCVVAVKAKKDSKYVEIDGLNIYHPTDPKVEAVPKDAEAMAMLAASTAPTTASVKVAAPAAGATTAAASKPSANGNGHAKPAAAAGTPVSSTSTVAVATAPGGPNDFSDV